LPRTMLFTLLTVSPRGSANAVAAGAANNTALVPRRFGRVCRP
jgi:hypothetical protein